MECDLRREDLLRKGGLKERREALLEDAESLSKFEGSFVWFSLWVAGVGARDAGSACRSSEPNIGKYSLVLINCCKASRPLFRYI